MFPFFDVLQLWFVVVVAVVGFPYYHLRRNDLFVSFLV